jgi:threonine dehydratase
LYIPTYEDVVAAHERIRPYIHRTPVLTSKYFNDRTGAELFFKCENFQKAGAFKARGASNAVFGLSEERATMVCPSATPPAGVGSRPPW